MFLGDSPSHKRAVGLSPQSKCSRLSSFLQGIGISLVYKKLQIYIYIYIKYYKVCTGDFSDTIWHNECNQQIWLRGFLVDLSDMTWHTVAGCRRSAWPRHSRSTLQQRPDRVVSPFEWPPKNGQMEMQRNGYPQCFEWISRLPTEMRTLSNSTCGRERKMLISSNQDLEYSPPLNQRMLYLVPV